MNEELKPCLCGQEQNERQMLVIEQCDFDGYYVKCDSCGACGPVGYPGEEYDACDGSACDRANQEAESKAISMWNELWEEPERLRAELTSKDAEIKALNVLVEAMEKSNRADRLFRELRYEYPRGGLSVQKAAAMSIEADENEATARAAVDELREGGKV